MTNEEIAVYARRFFTENCDIDEDCKKCLMYCPGSKYYSFVEFLNEHNPEEKKHGHWQMDYSARNPLSVCSECGLSNNQSKTNYCPHCGAKMR